MNNNPKRTALVKHVFNTKPSLNEVDFSRKKGLKKVKKKRTLKIHETNQIILHGTEALNLKSCGVQISLAFFNLIKRNARHPSVHVALQPTSYFFIKKC